MILHNDFFEHFCVTRGLISSQAILHRKKVDTGFIQAGMSPGDDLQSSAISKSLYKIPVSVQVKLVFLHIQNYIQTLRSAKTCQKMLRCGDRRREAHHPLGAVLLSRSTRSADAVLPSL